MEHAGLRFVGVPERGAEIVRVYGRGETVAHRIRGLERGLEVIGGDDAHDRAEDLLLRERHPRVDLAEDRRLNEVPGAQVGARRRAPVDQALLARALAPLALCATLP